MDFLGESASSSTSAVDVVAFVKEVIETYPNLRKSILVKLLESLPQVRASKVYRSSLWIIGEYSEDQEDITLAFATIKDALHDILNLETPSEAAQQTSAAAAPLPPAKPVGTGVLHSQNTLA
ncbi:Coatomer subunit beta [Pelomyxa schiedti]|nr:Coatomer subunit beta [Pelomyxa schiedti]